MHSRAARAHAGLPPVDRHVLTTEQRVDVVSSLRIRAHELSQDAALSYATPEQRADWLAESDRLTALARLLEHARITVEKERT